MIMHKNVRKIMPGGKDLLAAILETLQYHTQLSGDMRANPTPVKIAVNRKWVGFERNLVTACTYF